jgi:maltose/moltooligosaccharide transporter
MLFITVMWTVFSTKEYPPHELGHAEPETLEKKKIDNEDFYKQKFIKLGLFFVLVCVFTATMIYISEAEKELYVLVFGLGLFGVIHLLAVYYIRKGMAWIGLVHIVKDFNSMPKTMIQLAYVQFFSWFALFAMWIYTTSAVTSHIYGSTDTTSKAYNDGADLVSSLFGVYNGIAAVAALLLPLLARYTSRRITHLIALSCGGLGLISIYFVSNPSMLWFSMIGVGIAWASILSVPYAMLSGSLPANKMGYYMGVFNFFIVIPQIIAGTVLGFLLKHAFGGHPIYIIVTGGISMIIAGLLCLNVRDKDEVVLS